MSIPPDEPKVPDEPDAPDDGDEKGDGHEHDGIAGLPPGAKPRQIKVIMSQSAQEVKFADMFGFTLSPTHGLVKFGVFQPETGEFIVHTQIALTPQGMVALSQSLAKNIEKVRKAKPQPGQSMN